MEEAVGKEFVLSFKDQLTGNQISISDLKGKVVVIDFWATWCGPCKAIAPMIDELAAEYSGKLKIGKVNVDENPKTPGKYG
ncbi:MAG: redoxin domain-containing protein, partial [Spirochaetales bacterium]|nr:redoxin domain-containing protein [Spirochaetales bacterium]